ncbi:MAG: hypothetical protein EOO63_06030 [Hymenobacter sp.]|nr:MAG: hypothetical protein EOO63_06030 [Hymenobacter sp.]
MDKKLVDNGLLSLSYLLSTGCLVGILVINHKIATLYLEVSGKTRGLFGLLELVQFGYQYDLLLPLAIALGLGIICYRRKCAKNLSVTAILFASGTMILLVSDIWQLLV